MPLNGSKGRMINMLLSGCMNVLIYKKKVMEFEQGNQKLNYYRVICDVNDEVDELPCSQEVYEKAQPGKENLLTWQYNTKADRNAFKFIHVGLSDDGKPKN